MSKIIFLITLILAVHNSMGQDGIHTEVHGLSSPQRTLRPCDINSPSKKHLLATPRPILSGVENEHSEEDGKAFRATPNLLDPHSARKRRKNSLKQASSRSQLPNLSITPEKPKSWGDMIAEPTESPRDMNLSITGNPLPTRNIRSRYTGHNPKPALQTKRHMHRHTQRRQVHFQDSILPRNDGTTTINSTVVAVNSNVTSRNIAQLSPDTSATVYPRPYRSQRRTFLNTDIEQPLSPPKFRAIVPPTPETPGNQPTSQAQEEEILMELPCSFASQSQSSSSQKISKKGIKRTLFVEQDEAGLKFHKGRNGNSLPSFFLAQTLRGNENEEELCYDSEELKRQLLTEIEEEEMQQTLKYEVSEKQALEDLIAYLEEENDDTEESLMQNLRTEDEIVEGKNKEANMLIKSIKSNFNRFNVDVLISDLREFSDIFKYYKLYLTDVTPTDWLKTLYIRSYICYHKAFNNKEPGNTNFTDHKNKLLDRARYFAEQAVKIDPSYEADSLLYQDEESQAYLKNRSELDALQDGISESWLDSSLAKQYISELKILREEWLQEWGLHRPTGHMAAKQFVPSPTIAGTTEDDLPTQPYVSSKNQSSQNILSAHGTSNPTTHVTESSILEGDVREVNPITFSLPQIEIRDPGLNSEDLLRNTVLKVVTSNGVFYGAFTPLTPRMNR